MLSEKNEGRAMEMRGGTRNFARIAERRERRGAQIAERAAARLAMAEGDSPYVPGRTGPRRAGEPVLALRTYEKPGGHKAPVFLLTGTVKTRSGAKVRVRKTLGLVATEGANRLLAERLKSLYEAQVLADPEGFLATMGVEVPGASMTWGSLVREYGAAIAGASHASQSILRRMGEAIPADTPIRKVDQDMVEEAVGKIVRPGASEATIARTVGQFQAALNFAAEQGWRKPVRLDRPKVKAGRTRWLDDEELEDVLGRLEPLMADVATVLAYTGARVGELEALCWEDVGREGMTLASRKGSGRGREVYRERVVPLHPKVEEVLMRRPTRSGAVWPEFVGRTRFGGSGGMGPALNRAMREVGATGVTAHVLRHTFISRLVKAGVGMKEVQELAGHATLEMTGRYTHLANGALAEAVKRLT